MALENKEKTLPLENPQLKEPILYFENYNIKETN